MPYIKSTKIRIVLFGCGSISDRTGVNQSKNPNPKKTAIIDRLNNCSVLLRMG
jgi:hypothetical protein